MTQQWRPIEYVKEQSLFRNASFLIMSTAIMSLLGFGFWLFVAHLYTPEQVGIASALIAISTLLSSSSMFGLDSGLIRFLPRSLQPNRDINAALLVVGALSVVATLAYVLLSLIFPTVALPLGGWETGAFALVMVVVSLNSLTDSVFIANRRAEFHTIVYAVFGLIRLVVPILLVGLGWLGIFTAYAVAALVALLLSFLFMAKVTGYNWRTAPDWRFIPRARKYSFNNYVGTILGGVPAQIMPLIIIQQFGAAEAAYFSMAWTMANLLYVAPSSVAQSLLAESSHQPEQKSVHAKHAVKILSVMLVPAVALAVLVAPYLLTIFGPQYAQGGTVIFQLLALATFFVAVASVCNTVLNVEHRTSGIVLARLVNLVVTLGLTPLLLPMGLTGIGIAMLLGFAASNVVYLFLFLPGRRVKQPA